MRTQFALAATLALFLSMAFFAGSGFNEMVRGDRGSGQLDDQIQGAANDSALSENGSLKASRSASDDGSIAGLIISGGQQGLDALMVVVMLPTTLMNLGFPAWFAGGVGNIIRIVVGIGFVQFVLGRVYQ